jgi:protein involved in polysaccharide export with SLBB domain
MAPKEGLRSMTLLALAAVWMVPLFVQAQSGVMACVPSPGDRILIRTPQIEKIDGRTFQIQADGFVTLPSIGRVQAAGLEISSLEKLLVHRLKHNKSGEPKVTISVVANSNARPSPR